MLEAASTLAGFTVLQFTTQAEYPFRMNPFRINLYRNTGEALFNSTDGDSIYFQKELVAATDSVACCD
jgi:hypothetical protein